jgi:hypothetical protein
VRKIPATMGVGDGAVRRQVSQDRDPLLRMNSLMRLNATRDMALENQTRFKSMLPWGMNTRIELSRSAPLKKLLVVRQSAGHLRENFTTPKYLMARAAAGSAAVRPARPAGRAAVRHGWRPPQAALSIRITIITDCLSCCFFGEKHIPGYSFESCRLGGGDVLDKPK